MKTKEWRKFLACACLCLAVGWAAHELALRTRGDAAHPAQAMGESGESTARGVVRPHALSGNGKGESREHLAAQRAAARCTTAALWELIRKGDGAALPGGWEGPAIARELLDREGAAAMDKLAALGDVEFAETWHGVFLHCLAEKDTGKALELYLALPTEERDKDKWNLKSKLLKEAMKNSADSMVKTMEALKGAGGRSMPEVGPPFPEEFDFRKVLDYAAGDGREIAGGATKDMAFEWAAHSPLDALDWCRAHQDLPDGIGEGDRMTGVLHEISQSKSPEREEALLRIAQYYTDQGQRDEMWRTLAGGEGKADLELVRIAATMGSAQAYLVKALSETYGRRTIDPGWAQVPADLREEAETQMLAEWAKKDPTPNGEKTREHWQKRMAMVCGE